MKYEGIPYLPDEEYAKAIGQLRLQLNGVFEPFNIHGLHIYIPGAKEEIIKLAEDFSLRCRGQDKPISLEYIRRKKSKRG